MLATGAALLVAAVLLLTVVLPAERGFDPTGVGGALGVTALARDRPIDLEPGEYRIDHVELELLPEEWAEYGYRLEEGASMVFSWRATGDVMYDFHSAPDGGPPSYAESFDARQAAAEAHGTYVAPFSGIHGWYFENRGDEEVTIRLSTAGFYESAHVGRERASGERRVMTLDEVAGREAASDDR